MVVTVVVSVVVVVVVSLLRILYANTPRQYRVPVIINLRTPS